MDPLFSVMCPGPDPDISITSHMGSTDLVRAEESGTLWLWAWPKLLGWREDITWLFSPVAGKFPWPGDLWGVDTLGELLIVETKAAKRNRGQGPFRDFMGYEVRKPTCDGCSVFESNALRRRWDSLLAKEEQFIGANLENLRSGMWVKKRSPGIVPYSSKRVEVWRWRTLYLDKIAPKILAQSYLEAVSNNLAVRESRRDLLPHYVGLLTVCGEGNPHLSRKGQREYKCLKEEATAGSVHLIAVKAEPRDARNVEISSWRLP